MSELIARLIPTPGVALAAGSCGLIVGLLGSQVAGRLRARGTPVAYTRKIFHFMVFTGAAIIHGLWGLPGTNSYGGVVALLVLVAVYRSDGNPFYEALARDKDRPHRSLFILVPLVTTALGGLASALLAGPLASVGYLVGGWGDAVGEPVGRRWGRHPYKVPSLAGVPAERTVEGSTAVFLAGWLAASVALWGIASTPAAAVTTGLAVAVVAAVVEGVSTHGMDNLTVQVSASLTALWLLG